MKIYYKNCAGYDEQQTCDCGNSDLVLTDPDGEGLREALCEECGEAELEKQPGNFYILYAMGGFLA